MLVNGFAIGQTALSELRANLLQHAGLPLPFSLPAYYQPPTVSAGAYPLPAETSKNK